jgi:hypothetical protein
VTKRDEVPTLGEGERMHEERRKRFWKIMGGLALIGAIAGFVSGFVTGASDARGVPVDPAYLTLAAVAVPLVAILTLWGSWKFFTAVDELEVADNLWGSLIGFYAYLVIFPSWWALHQLGKASEPNDWIIYGIAMVTSLVAYAVRKWRAR